MVTMNTDPAPAPAATYEKGQLYHIPLADLQADPNQPRKVLEPEALDELAASIARHGVLQPVLFRTERTEAGGAPDAPPALFLVAGERRWEAAKKAALFSIPALLVEGNDAEIALVENLLRQDLTAVEEAEALQRLMDERNYSQEQLAGMIGKARTTINEILSVNRLPQAIRDECRGDRRISRNVLIDIARKKQSRGMQTAYEKYREKMRKEAEGRTRREKTPETAEEVVQWLGKAVRRLDNLDTSAWTEEERTAFSTALTDLKITVLSLLKK